MRKTIFSGIKPTGTIGLGNYLGTFKEWGNLQEENNCIFSVVDLHALTIRNDPKELLERTKTVAMLYMAAGIDPEKSIIYCQSHVKEHGHLSWILSCYGYMGELSRMTQYKDYATENDNVNTGMFMYPVLMAADILLYQSSMVPVGEDQRQHLELARDIAIRFNNIYGDVFIVPETLSTTKLSTRVKGLQNPTKKMSKSTTDMNDTIFLLDTPEQITKKIKKSVTDSQGEVYFDAENKPGISNLLSIYAEITKKTIEQSVSDFKGQNYGSFKAGVAEVIVDELKPLQERFYAFKNDRGYVDSILLKNKDRAAEIASDTVLKVEKAIGLK